MARMLGRNRSAGCGPGCCRHCQRGGETRYFKRREQRQVDREAADALARFRRVLEEIGPGDKDGEGDLSRLADEISDWAPLRKEATMLLLGGD